MRNHSIAAVVIAVAATSGVTAQETRRPGDASRRTQRSKYLETGGERKLEVVYKNVSGRDLTLDLYHPTAGRSRKCPVIVFTHGGGWAAGNRYKAARGSFGLVFGRLVKEGFAVAPVTYRLAKKDSNVAMRDCVIDCKDAIRYLAKNSESLGIDPMRMCVMGDSAGGHIAQMLLLASADQMPGDSALAEVPYRMVAGVSWYGPCDFEKRDIFNHDNRANFKDRFTARILGSNSGPMDKLARYREVSPINYLSKDSPPLLMIQGDKDTTIPVKHAYYMKQKADAVKAPVEIIRNAGPRFTDPDSIHSPMDQGFALQVESGGEKRVFTLDSKGFEDVVFTNRYPMARVAYGDAACPVKVELEAYTPFIPLNRDDSSYPVIVMRYTMKNATDRVQETAIAGWVENLSNFRSGKGKASAVMARQMKQAAVALRYERIVAKGAPAMVDMLWNEEYGHFIHKPGSGKDEKHGSTNGCHIDQVLGEFWLRNLGLDRVLPQDKIRRALESLWTFNFSPNVGDFRKVMTDGRWYAVEGNAGLVMCSFPHGKVEPKSGKKNYAGYLNECMTGFEWQVAAHMIWEGLVEKGLAIGKAIYDRYLPKDRNPYNEIECSDHYARAMASYSAFMAICGYRYDGPEGKLAFGPRMQQDNFRAAFTTAEGWGCFSQTIKGGRQENALELRYGKLHLKQLTLEAAPGTQAGQAVVRLDGRDIDARSQNDGARTIIRFPKGIDIATGQTLQVQHVSKDAQ